MNYQDLKNKYSEFKYRNYSFNLKKNILEVSFEFSIGNEFLFKPKIEIQNINEEHFKKISIDVINNLAFNLGLVEMLSYWKTTASPQIIIEAGYLSGEQTDWWKKLLMNGMKQFLFENNIDFKADSFVEITSIEESETTQKAEIKSNSLLIPVGGGKDSAVTLELLKNSSEKVGIFSLNPTYAVEEFVHTSGIKDRITVIREIDPLLLAMNKQGYLNGHTPFSAYLSFLSVFCAVLFDYKDIAFSNERSSNESNTQFLGEEVNHQYSKTYEYENDFRQYNAKYLSNVNYFSFLRPLHEIQISKLFALNENYFGIIRSCNVGQKTNSWCCKCPKCLSTFILLYPFLGIEKMRQVFPENLYEDETLKSLLDELVDEDKVKPFECVGTRRELRDALYLSFKLHQENLPALLSYASDKLKDEMPLLKVDSENIMTEWDSHNNLNPAFEKILKEKYA